MPQKRVLITGGAGFLGSNLARALLQDGAHVDCVDNLITGRLESIQSLRAIDRFRFFKLDITDERFLAAALANRYDEIFHLACPTGVPNIATFGEEMIRTCSLGTEHVLRVACTHNARLVYASSAEVYGNPEVFPQREHYCGNVDPVGPRSAYEEGKRFGESLVRLYARKYETNAKIVRIFNTFGVGMHPEDSRVIPHFLRRIRERKNLIIYGDGTQTRTHLYVADLLAGLQTVIDKGTAGEAYNVGGDEQLTILELVEIMRSLTPQPIGVEHRPHFIEDHGGRLPNTEKVKALGWRPSVPIQDGIHRMLVSHGIPTHGTAEETRAPRTRPQPSDHVPAPTDA